MDYSHFPRPRYLSDATHALCRRALQGEFGKAMAEHYCAVVDAEAFAALDSYRQYCLCLRAVVEQAPIRLVDGEWLAGSATFDKARAHELPVALTGQPKEKQVIRSVSHLTPHFQKVLKRGLAGLEAEIADSMEKLVLKAKFPDPEAAEYLDILRECVDCVRFWHAKTLSAVEERISETEGDVKRRWQTVRENLKEAPLRGAKNFREAIQSLWFIFSVLRLTGNWVGLGRIDWMLGPYLEKDLAEGAITLEEAREYIAHFWIKGCEWVDCEKPIGHPDEGGDGQFYQNVVLSGRDARGNDETNAVTYLVLDVLEELGIADFPTSVRIHRNSPEKLMRRVAEVTRHGGGLMAVYNDETVVNALVNFGFSREEACRFANDGCWEVQVPGRTRFRYWAWDVLAELQQNVLKLGDHAPSDLKFRTFDELFDAYISHLRQVFFRRTEHVPFWRFLNPLLSLLVEDCIASARDYGNYSGTGAAFHFYAPHAGGIVDAANALQAIQYAVYEKKLLSLNAFLDIVKADWEGHEDLRQQILGLTYYGNGDEKGDAMMKRLFDAYVSMIAERKFHRGVLFPAGISTFGRQVTPEFLDHRTANPDGHKKGDYLSNNISPTPGTDLRGATAVLRSYGSLGMEKLPGGTALEVKMSSATVRGQDGLDGLVDLLYSFCELGCHFMQLDVADAALLQKAYEDPEAYGDLVVRVSGWSSRFRTLGRQWQRLVVERTEMGY